MARNMNGFDTHAASTSDYDRDTFNAKTSPDTFSKSKDYSNTSNDPQFTAQPMTITITEPQKESEGSSGTYISYLITTHVSLQYAHFEILMPRPMLTEPYVID
jgi:hypothetical protein